MRISVLALILTLTAVAVSLTYEPSGAIGISRCDMVSVEKARTRVNALGESRTAVLRRDMAGSQAVLASKLETCYSAFRGTKISVESPLSFLDQAAVTQSLAATDFRRAGDRSSACTAYRSALTDFRQVLRDRYSYGPDWIDASIRNGAAIGLRTTESEARGHCI